MFAQEINASRASYPTIEEFTALTDFQLADMLKNTPAGEWLKGENHHGWRMVADKSFGSQPVKVKVEAKYPKVNLRLSTPVMGDNGKIGSWKELFPKEAEPLITLEQRSGKPIKLIYTEG